jgi:hypothetical protein
MSIYPEKAFDKNSTSPHSKSSKQTEARSIIPHIIKARYNTPTANIVHWKKHETLPPKSEITRGCPLSLSDSI